MRKLIIGVMLLLPCVLWAQEESSFGIKFSGFVKYDAFFDTRQTTAAREGHFLLYPNKEVLDKNGEDINATPNFNMLAIQTRLTGRITGPDAFGAKTSGVIEGAFFGHTDADINGYRLRHAFAKLNWTKTELLAGQYWHPFLVPFCFPEVISFNTGVPFQPFSRNPQLRLTHQLSDKFSVMVAAMSQRDFASPGGSTSLRNSAVPDMQLQMVYGNPKEGFVAGASAGYKILKPRLVTDSLVKANESISSASAQVFLKYSAQKFDLKLMAVYGQNLFDLTMLGGYAIQYDTLLQNFAIDHRNYTNIETASIWVEYICKRDKKILPGFFAGYSQNMGSANNIQQWTSASSYFSRGRDIRYVYRLSPRMVYTSGKMKFALECEYTVAGYGNTLNSLGEVLSEPTDLYPNAELKAVSNIRALFSAIYSF